MTLSKATNWVISKTLAT